MAPFVDTATREESDGFNENMILIFADQSDELVNIKAIWIN